MPYLYAGYEEGGKTASFILATKSINLEFSVYNYHGRSIMVIDLTNMACWNKITTRSFVI